MRNVTRNHGVGVDRALEIVHAALEKATCAGELAIIFNATDHILNIPPDKFPAHAKWTTSWHVEFAFRYGYCCV